MDYAANHGDIEAGVAFATASIDAESLVSGVANKLAQVHNVTASPAVDLGMANTAKFVV